MGKSLYNIQDEYLQLMNEIEEGEDELTPELEERLKINEQECESKIKAYYHIIKSQESDMQLIKDERERLSVLSNTKENIIKRLKNKVLDACIFFGYDGKSGNKKIDYDTLKVYTVNKDKIEVEEEQFIEYANKELWKDTENEALEYTLSIKVSHKKARILINNSNGNITNDNFVVNINKTLIKDTIEKGIEVPYCKKVNNPYITFR